MMSQKDQDTQPLHGCCSSSAAPWGWQRRLNPIYLLISLKKIPCLRPDLDETKERWRLARMIISASI